MREREKECARLGAQLITVIAHEPLWIRHLPGVKVPDQVPFPVLADSAAIVSAIYGTAFQVKMANGWSSRQATFVIDHQGVIREVRDGPRIGCCAESSDLLQFLADLEEERALIESLSVRNASLRGPVALALAPVGPETKACVPVFVNLLGDDDPRARAAAAAALNWIAPEAGGAVPALIDVIGDENPRVRRLAVTTLGRIGDDAEAAIPALVPLVKGDDPRMRATALLAMERIGTAAMPALIEMLKDNDAPIRLMAASTFAQFPRDAHVAVPALVATLKDEDVNVRTAAALTLRRIPVVEGDLRATAHALIESFQDPDIQRVALGTLVQIGTTEDNAHVITPLLVESLENANEETRASLAKALMTIDPQAAKNAGLH